MKEEVWAEQLVENLDFFRAFSEVAAQTNGAIVNFAKIAKDDGINANYRFSYFKTNDGAEIDLIVERPGMPLALIEIKSSTQPSEEDADHISRLRGDFGPCECYCFSNVATPRIVNDVKFLHWKDGLRELLRTPTELLP